MADPEVLDAPVTSHDPDALTAAEQEYLNSGGEKADGLLAEAGVTAPEKVVEQPKDKVADGAAKPEVKAGEPEKGAAEPSDDDDDEPEQPKDGRQRTVSYKKFERTRKKLDEQLAAERKAGETTARTLAELQEKYARGDERLKLLTEALAPPAADTAQADPRPDPEQDIFAYVKWQDRQIENLKGQVGETRDTITERGQADTLKNEYQADALSFARETPDFGHAYTHLLNTRGAMLESQGYSIDDVRKILFNEEKQLVERARATGKRPSAMVYALAQQLGYRKADSAAAAAEAPAVTNGNGNGTAPAVNGEAKPSVSEEIARIAAGQAAGKTLSGAGGAASEMSIESLSGMSDAEFEAFYAKNRGKVDAMLGKRH